MIDLRYVKKLLDMLDGSTVDSIEISSDKGMKIRISKTPAQRGTVQVAAPMAMPPAMLAAPAASAGQLGAGGGRPTPAEGVPVMGEGDGRGGAGDAAKSRLLEVKSPMVGTFYASPEPGAPAYVTAGSRVAKGQVLCIIEAMKIMNEIESEFAGVVKEVLASDAHPVEYGQVLFRVDPNG
ncbi:MAG TPA: acetyl-CoA carboxylase biotin carboxyl carrier protein [Gemmatimonadaceae bacterium]|nr:acetyl-CoA carboxylase biotin carboxyl carrier protein [Gemmatimonadaceae bacterium]